MKPSDTAGGRSWAVLHVEGERLSFLTDSLEALLADTIEIFTTIIGDEFLGGALREAGLSGGQFLDCCCVLMDSLGWNVQQPGDSIQAVHWNGVLRELRAFPRYRRGYYRIGISPDGDICEWEYVPEDRWTRLRAVEGVVESTVWHALWNSSLPDDLTPTGLLVTGRDSSRAWGYIAELQHLLTDRILAYDIDFYLDVRDGDRFWVLLEETCYPGSEETSFTRVMAVKYQFAGGGVVEAFPFFHMPSDSLQGLRVLDYFHRDGGSVRTMFLKMPVPYGRISSGYSDARLHPILGYTRAHRGIDYAAPLGTEIFAVGDGMITMRQYNGGYGNYVRIRHANGYETGYGHLSSFASGRSVGTYVRQGDVIGYVGSTGLSTGPHVHFEMKRNGVFINPALEILPPADPLTGEELERYLVQVESLESVWSAMSGGTLPVAVEEEGPTELSDSGSHDV